MTRIRTAILLALFATSPVLAAKVYIDYDKDAAHNGYKTWTYMPNEGKTSDQLMDSRLEDGLRAMMGKTPLTEVPEGGDLYVTYTVSTQERAQYNTVSTGYGYGYGGGWGGYGRYGYGGVGMGSSTTYETTYTDGTLVVDAWDPKTEKLVWRGSATDTLKAKPEKLAAQIDKAYTQMWSYWERIKRDAEKANSKKK